MSNYSKADQKRIKNIQDYCGLSESDAQSFLDNAKRYIKASEQSRIICNIDSVSSSGMSRTLKFLEMSFNGKRSHLLNFWTLFKNLGYTPVKNNRSYFRIHGCGMDMVFATHYNVIMDLKRLEILTPKKAEILAQNTPHTV